MKNRNLIYLAIVVLAAILVYTLSTMDLSDEDLGVLTVSNYDENLQYCRYEIKGYETDPQVDPYYSIGDLVCIECCDEWPPEVQENQNCYTYITFETGDGLVEYEAELQDTTNKDCVSCSDAKGYYACPEE